MTTLATFDGTNGSRPIGGLTLDADNNLYGTAYASNTVFKLTPGGTLSTVGTFNGANGSNPSGGVIFGPGGFLYGTTNGGGASGFGTVFRLSPGGGTPQTLANFNGSTTGRGSEAGLAFSGGNLYGVTTAGGSSSNGTVFRLTSNNVFTTLGSFTGANGNLPLGRPTADGSGNLYGTTVYGGATNGGVVYRVSPAGAITALSSLGGALGNSPVGSLAVGPGGTLYGTTARGGTADRGTVFKVTTGGVVTTLADFGSALGRYPEYDITVDAAGNVFGVTAEGGGGNNSGTAFKVSPDGTVTTLVSFVGPNGFFPVGGLVADASGNLYGETLGSNQVGAPNVGTIYKITDSGFVVVPEPASLGLLAGAAIVGRVRRRRRATDTTQG